MITIVTLYFSDHPGIDADKPFYFQKLEKIAYAENQLFFDLDCVHLKDFDESLYRQLINYPSELIPIFDMATNEVFYDKVAKSGQILEHQIQVRPFNVDRTKSLRSLDPNDIDQLVTIRGIIMILVCKIYLVEKLRNGYTGDIFSTRNVRSILSMRCVWPRRNGRNRKGPY